MSDARREQPASQIFASAQIQTSDTDRMRSATKKAQGKEKKAPVRDDKPVGIAFYACDERPVNLSAPSSLQRKQTHLARNPSSSLYSTRNLKQTRLPQAVVMARLMSRVPRCSSMMSSLYPLHHKVCRFPNGQ